MKSNQRDESSDLKSDTQDEKSLFLRALEIADVQRRDEWLSRMCRGDTALRREIDELLRAHAASEGLLTSAAAPAEDSTLASDGSNRTSGKPSGRVGGGSAALPSRAASYEKFGDAIGPYKLLERLGEGGFGTVWVAEQKEPVRRRVALKIIKVGMDTREVIARFEAERQALALMDHPNIARVLDAGATETGRPFFVMELVRGTTITDYCDKEKLDLRGRLDLLVLVCQAVQHAHQKGIIHRDIKPSNVMVTMHDGVPVPKVIDFGIAKATQQELTEKTIYTQYSQFIGTPAYMSPEQAEMSGLDIDTRSDIYSLGVLFYELLTGSPPFDAEQLLQSGLDEMRKIIRERDPEKPSTRLSRTLTGADRTATVKRGSISGLPSDLDWIVMKCLEKDRRRRYDTAADVAMDVKRHLEDNPILARPPSAGYRMRKAWRRNRLSYTAGALVAASLVVGITVSLWHWAAAQRAYDQVEQARAAEQAQRVAAQEEAGRANQAEASIRQRAYASDLLLARYALDDHDLREARQLLDRQHPEPDQADLRGWEWRYLSSRARGGTLFELGPAEHRVVGALFSNHRDSLVTYEAGGQVNRWSLDRREAEMLAPRQAKNGRLDTNSSLLSVSGDRNWIAAEGKREDGIHVARIWNLAEETPAIEVILGIHKATSLSLLVTEDGGSKRLAAYFPEQGSCRVWDVDTKKVIHQDQLEQASGKFRWRGAICFSPDGKTLAVGGVEGQLRLLDTESWSRKTQEDIEFGSGITTLAFSPDSRTLAMGRGFVDPRIYLIDPRTGKQLDPLLGHTGFISDLTFSDDGSLLASASADQTIKLWNTGDWTESRTFSGHTDEVWCVDFSPVDQRRLVSGGKDCRILVWSIGDEDLEDGSTPLPRESGTLQDISPDGTRFLTLSEGEVRVDGAPVLPATDPGREIEVAWWISPDEILMSTTDPPALEIRDLGTGSTERILLGTSAAEIDFAYLPPSGVVVAAFHDPDEEEATVTRWDVATRQMLSSCRVTSPVPRRRDLARALSRDGRFLATAHSPLGGTKLYQKISVFDLTDGRCLNTIGATGHGVQGLALSPDGKIVAYATRAAPKVRVCEVASGRELRRLEGHKLVILSLEFSPDGKRLLSGTIGAEPVKLWDTRSWLEVFRFEPDPGTYHWNPRFLSDGNSIAANQFSFSNNEIRTRYWQAQPLTTVSEE